MEEVDINMVNHCKGDNAGDGQTLSCVVPHVHKLMLTTS